MKRKSAGVPAHFSSDPTLLGRRGRRNTRRGRGEGAWRGRPPAECIGMCFFFLFLHVQTCSRMQQPCDHWPPWINNVNDTFAYIQLNELSCKGVMVYLSIFKIIYYICIVYLPKELSIHGWVYVLLGLLYWNQCEHETGSVQQEQEWDPIPGPMPLFITSSPRFKESLKW